MLLHVPIYEREREGATHSFFTSTRTQAISQKGASIRVDSFKEKNKSRLLGPRISVPESPRRQSTFSLDCNTNPDEAFPVGFHETAHSLFLFLPVVNRFLYRLCTHGIWGEKSSSSLVSLVPEVFG